MIILSETNKFSSERSINDRLPHDDTIDSRLIVVDVLLADSRKSVMIIRWKWISAYSDTCIVISFDSFEYSISFSLLIFICSKFDLILFSQMLIFIGYLREMTKRTKEESMIILLHSFELLNDYFPEAK